MRDAVFDYTWDIQFEFQGMDNETWHNTCFDIFKRNNCTFVNHFYYFLFFDFSISKKTNTTSHKL